MSDTVVAIDFPEDLTAGPIEAPVTEEAPVAAEIPTDIAAARPGPGRPRKAAVAVSRTGTNGKAPAKPKATKPAITKGKPAVTKRTAGKDIATKGAAEGTTLTSTQQKAVEKITKLLTATSDLEVKRSSYMWEVSEQIHGLLAPTDSKIVPVKQKDLARIIGVDPTNISIWAKTWRNFGDPKNRVVIKGAEVSFNDHVERARMLDDNGNPAQKDLYEAIEKEAAETGNSFAVAKRSVRQGPSPSSLDIGGARDRVNQFAGKINELAGPTPNDEAMTMTLFALQDVLAVAGDIVARRIANGETFTSANKQFIDGYEAAVGSLVDQIRAN